MMMMIYDNDADDDNVDGDDGDDDSVDDDIHINLFLHE